MTRRPADQPALTLPLPEGVHLRMPQQVFDDARAIGPADLRVLYWQPQSWWFASDYNLARRVKVKSARRAAQDLASALKVLVLEGEVAYRERFAFQPDEESSRWIRTPVELKQTLEDMGVDTRGIYGPALNQLARKKGIANRVWEIAWSSYEAAKRDRAFITEADDIRVRQTAGLIVNHAELGPALAGGLTNVSVLWRREDDPDTLLRARFDCLRVKRIYDLQPLQDWRGRDLDAAIEKVIGDHDHEIERRLYPEAFDALVRFVDEGRVYGWSAEGATAAVLSSERAQLKQIAAAGAPEWIWIFVQLRNDAVGQERAPVVSPRWHQPEGKLWEAGGKKIGEALAEFRRLRSEHSLERPWALVEEVRELVDADVRTRLKKEST